MPYYSTITTREEIDAIMSISGHSVSFANSISIYGSAISARNNLGITTQEQLDAHYLNAYLADEKLWPTGSHAGSSFDVYFGEGGNGTGPYNVFATGTSSYVQNATGHALASLGIISSRVNSGRQVFGGGAAHGVGGSGGGGTTPVPFLIGEYWQTYRYQSQVIAPAPVRYLKAIRPPKMGNGYFGNVDRRATIRIMDKEGLCWYATANFALQNVTKKAVEGMSIMQTSEGSIPLFGEPQLRVFGISGTLLNADDYDWAREWKSNWDSYFSATTLLDNNARFYLLYGGWLLAGYLMEYSIGESAKSPYMDIIQFQVMITDYEPLPDMTEIDLGDGVSVDRWQGKENFISGQNIRSAGTEIAKPINQQELIVKEESDGEVTSE